MAKGFYSYIKQAWKKPSEEKIAETRKKMIAWRAGERVAKIEKPSRLDRARTLGYKAKKGFVIARVTIERGGRVRPRPRKKRRSSRQHIQLTLKMNYQWVAEQRAQRKFRNLEVLNSYLLGKDGRFYFYEVIMVDPNVPEIKSDKNLNFLCRVQNRFRVFRGLTSAAKKSRGLRNKGPELKVRPSVGAWHGRGK